MLATRSASDVTICYAWYRSNNTSILKIVRGQPQLVHACI